MISLSESLRIGGTVGTAQDGCEQKIDPNYDSVMFSIRGAASATPDARSSK
jgi:hypothetical protein